MEQAKEEQTVEGCDATMFNYCNAGRYIIFLGFNRNIQDEKTIRHFIIFSNYLFTQLFSAKSQTLVQQTGHYMDRSFTRW